MAIVLVISNPLLNRIFFMATIALLKVLTHRNNDGIRMFLITGIIVNLPPDFALMQGCKEEVQQYLFFSRCMM